MMIFSINRMEVDTKKLWSEWKHGARAVWRRSKTLFIALAASQFILGFLPYFFAKWFGGFIDAVFGARSLGLWTDDVNKMMWGGLGFVILGCVTLFVTAQFSGVSASVARGVRWAALIGSSFFVLLPISPVTIIIVTFGLITEPWIERRLRAVLWFCMIVLLVFLYVSLANSMVYHVLTIGEGIELSLLMLVIPARRFIDRYFVCA